MIAIRPPGDLDPDMKSALKNHIMRKRQQLKQELEQDEIEKRLKREQEAKRKQDAMTLDQLKDQLSNLEKTLENLKNEKHSLFAQLKQNMRVLNEDDARRKQKEEELTAAARQQQQQQQQQQPQADQRNGVLDQPLPQLPQNQINHHQPVQTLNTTPHLTQISHRPPPPRPQSQQQQQQQLQQQQPQPIPAHIEKHSQPQHIHPMPHQTSSIPSGAPSGLSSPHESLPPKLPPNLSMPDPQGPIDFNQGFSVANARHLQQQQQQAAAVLNNQAAAAAALGLQFDPRKKMLPPTPSSSQPNQLPPGALNNPYLPYGGLPSGLGPTGPGGNLPANLFAGQNLMRTPPPPNINTLLSSAAISQLLSAHNFAQLSGHPQASLMMGHGIPTSLAHIPQTSSSIRPSASPMPNNSPLNNAGSKMPLNLPITSSQGPIVDFSQSLAYSNAQLQQQQQQQQQQVSAAAAAALGLPYEPPRKKMHTGQQPPQPPSSQSQQQQAQSKLLSSSLGNPYLSYANLPPGLGPAGGAPGSGLPASLFAQQNLMRTPPPANMNSFFNPAAISHLLNAHNYPQMGSHHPSPSLISGHGIPTSLAHMSQSGPMIRPSPPPMQNSSPMGNNGPPKMQMSMPMTSGQGPIDFNQGMTTSQAHQFQQAQQQAVLNSQAAATAAALGLPYDPHGKKMQPPPNPSHSQPNQLPANALTNPYLAYAGLPPGLAGAGARGLPPGFFAGQNLMRTPPPNISALSNAAAFSQLFNAHNFPRQSP